MVASPPLDQRSPDPSTPQWDVRGRWCSSAASPHRWRHVWKIGHNHKRTSPRSSLQVLHRAPGEQTQVYILKNIKKPLGKYTFLNRIKYCYFISLFRFIICDQFLWIVYKSHFQRHAGNKAGNWISRSFGKMKTLPCSVCEWQHVSRLWIRAKISGWADYCIYGV